MNGNPLPPIDAPPADGSIFIVCLMIIVGAILAFVLLAGKMDDEQEDRKRIFRNQIEHDREELVQMMIDQAPGGRKPWQYDPSVPTLDDLRRDLEERKSLARQKSGAPGE